MSRNLDFSQGIFPPPHFPFLEPNLEEISFESVSFSFLIFSNVEEIKIADISITYETIPSNSQYYLIYVIPPPSFTFQATNLPPPP